MLAQQSNQFGAVHVGHGVISHDDVGLDLGCGFEEFVARGGLMHHLQPVDVRKHGLDARAYDEMIFRHDDAQSSGGVIGRLHHVSLRAARP
jgi:hypothetical protein